MTAIIFNKHPFKRPMRSIAHEMASGKKPTLAEKLRAYRAALRDEGREPVDDFCRRGETTARFAYFD